MFKSEKQMAKKPAKNSWGHYKTYKMVLGAIILAIAIIFMIAKAIL